jgi:hypothetical protein
MPPLSVTRSIVQWQSTILVFLVNLQIHHRHGLEHFKVGSSRRRIMSRRHFLTAAQGHDHEAAATLIKPLTLAAQQYCPVMDDFQFPFVQTDHLEIG